jgi:xylan 1,4-beta-xylosidase
VDGVHRAIPTARIGGPETAGGTGGGSLNKFLDHCVSGTNAVTGKQGTPIDLISFHAKGSPKFVDGHVRMGISNQLRDIESGFAAVASYPTLKHLPIVIGESDPEGCAASFARKYELADKHGVNLEGALTWAFEFEDQPYFAGFRVLSSNGIDHPVLNVFRMFSKMSGQRLTTTSTAGVPLAEIVKNGVRNQPDVSALASRDGKKTAVMVWHYHDDDLAGPEAAVRLKIPGLPSAGGVAKVTHYRIDETRSNAFTLWKALGEPQKPTTAQYAELEQAGKLATLGADEQTTVSDHAVTVDFNLPRQGVSLLLIECE